MSIPCNRGELLHTEDFIAIQEASPLPAKYCRCAFFQAGRMGIFTGSGETGSGGQPNKIPTGEFEAECEHFAHGYVIPIVKAKAFRPKSTEVKFVRYEE